MATAASLTPFTLGEEHLAFRQSVRTLARSRYTESMLARSQSDKFPITELAELGAAGLLGLVVSESAGGQGGDVLAVGIAVEELAYADPSIAYLAFAANVSNALLAEHGSPEVRDRWVARGVAGVAQQAGRHPCRDQAPAFVGRGSQHRRIGALGLHHQPVQLRHVRRSLRHPGCGAADRRHRWRR